MIRVVKKEKLWGTTRVRDGEKTKIGKGSITVRVIGKTYRKVNKLCEGLSDCKVKGLYTGRAVGHL